MSIIFYSIQSSYLITFLIVYSINHSIVYYLPLFWTISCMLFSMNFTKNRNFIKYKLFRLKPKLPVMSGSNLSTHQSQKCQNSNVFTITVQNEHNITMPTNVTSLQVSNSNTATAATYHDAGFIEKYEKNEPIGARMAEEILPLYGYSESHIEKIKELIFVTKIPHAPKNNLEEIICDADLDYLGRSDFHEIAARLCKELIEHGKIENEKAWDEIQIKFLTHHSYFTKTARKNRKDKKEANLLEVIARLEENNYKP